jgi:Fe2+ or Zn2+ uptake regulation protein
MALAITSHGVAPGGPLGARGPISEREFEPAGAGGPIRPLNVDRIKMSPFQLTILEIIEANDGKYSWYQLDRALTQRPGGLDPAIVSKDLMAALRDLEEAGFITTTADHNPGQPLYSMTPRELEHLEIAAERTGAK